MHLCQYQQASADLREVLRLVPNDAWASNNLAWLVAVCPVAELRQPAEALQLSSVACERTAWQEAAILDTHAAALAANAQFEEAVERQLQAVALANEEQQADFRQRLELYQARRTYQEPVALPTETD